MFIFVQFTDLLLLANCNKPSSLCLQDWKGKPLSHEQAIISVSKMW